MRLLHVIVLLSVVLAGLALPASPAGAHAGYERSEPADGAVLPESPPRVDVWFSQEVRRSGGLPKMIVVNDAGDTVSLETVLDDEDRHRVYAELAPALPPGRYTVIWHTLSDEDGEEAQGAFHYYVGAGPEDGSTPTAGETPQPPSPPPSQPTPTPEPSSPEAADGDDGLPVWALVIGIIGGVAVGAGAGVILGRGFRR